MRTLIWGAGAIGGTLGAFLARAGHDVTMVDTVVDHVDAIARDGLRDDRTDRRVHGPHSGVHTAGTRRRVGRDHPRHEGASHRGCRPRAAPASRPATATWSRPRTASTSWRSPKSSAPRAPSAHSSISAPTTWSRASIHYGGHGAVVVGEIDGRITPRVTRDPRRMAALRRARDRDAEHLGLPVGQGGLRRDAVRHGADQRIDRRRARDAGLPAAVHRAGAGDPRGRSGPPHSAGGVRRFRPGGVSHRRPRPAPPSDRSTRSSRTIGARQSRTAASGATSPSGSGRPKSTRSSASSSRWAPRRMCRRRSRPAWSS